MYDILRFFGKRLFGLFEFLDSIIFFDTISLLKFLFIIMLFKLCYKFVGWVVRAR